MLKCLDSAKHTQLIMIVYLKRFIFVPKMGPQGKKLPRIDFNLWILFKREMIEKHFCDETSN